MNNKDKLKMAMMEYVDTFENDQYYLDAFKKACLNNECVVDEELKKEWRELLEKRKELKNEIIELKNKLYIPMYFEKLDIDSYQEKEIKKLELDIKRFKWELKNSDSEVRREMSKELINKWKIQIKILRGEK